MEIIVKHRKEQLKKSQQLTTSIQANCENAFEASKVEITKLRKNLEKQRKGEASMSKIEAKLMVQKEKFQKELETTKSMSMDEILNLKQNMEIYQKELMEFKNLINCIER